MPREAHALDARRLSRLAVDSAGSSSILLGGEPFLASLVVDGGGTWLATWIGDPMTFVTKVRVEKFGGREHVYIYLRGSCAGTLIVELGDGRQLAERLVPQGRWLKEQPENVEERLAEKAEL